MKSRKILPCDEALSLFKDRFRYDPETGEIWTRVARHQKQKYLKTAVKHDGRRYQVYLHQLAWFLKTGDWPLLTIDHVNRDSKDNRWVNLRLATMQQNCANMTPRSRTSGVKGSWLSSNGRYRAYIANGGGRNKYLGTFDTKEEAEAAYLAAAIERYGEFATLD